MFTARWSTPYVVVATAMFLLTCPAYAESGGNGNGNGNTTTTSSTTTTTSTAATTSTTTTSTTTSTTTTTTTTVAANTTTTLPDYPLEVCTTSVDPTQSGSAAAVTNSNIVQGDSTLFASYYNYSNKTGDLKAFTIDPSTGSIGGTAQWSALTILNAISSNQLDNTRKLYTYGSSGAITVESGNGNSSFCSSDANQTNIGVPSSVTNSNARQSTCQDIVNALKGANVTGYRTMASYRLGTIVHSEPVYVSNLKLVVQAANDGMVHAFTHDNSTIGNNNSSNGGEAWAYIPRAFLVSSGQSEAPKINTYVSSTYTSHQYWLDATPTIETFSTTSGNTTTYTNYFASGYGKSAKGAFALTLGASSPTPKWQFNTSTDSNAGYLYGRPIITKVNDSGSDTGTLKTVAIFASGFDSTDLSSLSSSSHLYVVDLSTTTPTLLKTFTVAGKGLNYIAGFADSYSTSNQVQYVYGGDMDGNVWRFDLTGTTTASWTVHKLASLSAPITSEPELGQITINGTPKRFVYVGTGRYLTPSDKTSGETGSMYGLIDRIDTVTGYSDSTDATTPSQLSTITLAQSTDTTSAAYTGSGATNPNNVSTYGWKVTLPTSQRVINSPALANGKVLFTANKPADPCDTNTNSPMESWLYVINYQTGLQTGYYSLASAASTAGLSDTHFLASRPTVIKLSSGDYRAMIRTTDGDTLNVDVGTLLTTSGGTGSTVKGVFWREVITQ